MDTINIAVIGADGVGKSSFIQRSLSLMPRSSPSNFSTNVLDVEGVQHVVTLFEFDLAEYFDVDPSQHISWPKQIDGHIVPSVDGALIVYDVMNKESIRDLPPILCKPSFLSRVKPVLNGVAALANSSVPTILAATKCDTPQNLWQLDTAAVATAFPSCIGDFNTSSNVPGTQRDCLQAMMRAALNNRRGKFPPAKPESLTAIPSPTMETPQPAQCFTQNARQKTDGFRGLRQAGRRVASEARSLCCGPRDSRRYLEWTPRRRAKHETFPSKLGFISFARVPTTTT
jgi:hypothetical protein